LRIAKINGRENVTQANSRKSLAAKINGFTVNYFIYLFVITYLNLPLIIALYQIKENATGIFILAYFFKEIWLKNSYFVAIFPATDEKSSQYSL